MPDKINRQQLAKLVSEAVNFYDPYNSFTIEEMESQTKQDLKTLQGCYVIIQELCNMILDN